MRTFRDGQTVHCPPDCGDAGYYGRVVTTSSVDCRNIHGVAYRWVTVQHPRGTQHVWPSHRLS